MVTIIDPHIKRDDGYHVKKLASEQQLFVRSLSGGEYDGWCWPGTRPSHTTYIPGSSSWIDYTSTVARKFWISLFDYASYIGSTEHLFTWNDMNEPSVFNGPEITMLKDNLHHDGWEHRDVHNLYGMMQVPSPPFFLIVASRNVWCTHQSFD
jgi:alpha 1,3-glucosidase